jgi:hypothetical protein
MQKPALDDKEAIKDLIFRQFGSLTWKKGGSGDWTGFAADFLPDAALYSSARPATPQSVTAFVERMKHLCGSTLQSFDERVLGSTIHVFGNIAIAMAAGEMVENETETSRNIEMMLLVKTDGCWRIAAQAWDRASASATVPEELLDPS